MRTTKEILLDLKKLVKEVGYIYCLSLIAHENFATYTDEFDQVKIKEIINLNEILLLLGFLSNKKIDLSYPTFKNLLIMKKNTEKLLKELHESYNTIFTEKLSKEVKIKPTPEIYEKARKEFFRDGNILIEAIFYAGTGVYDFQYSKFLENKYKYDLNWLSINKDYYLDKTSNIIKTIKKVNIDKINQILPKKSISNNNNTNKKEFGELIGFSELYPFFDRFARNINPEKIKSQQNLKKKIQEYTFKGLLDLFIIEKNNFNSEDNFDSFLDNFSFIPRDGINSSFEGIGSFNIINSKPIIQINKEKFFIIEDHVIYESVYNSPFYWMLGDENYKEESLKNRGVVGEEITSNLLLNIKNCEVYKSVKVKNGRNDFTDIDVLCVSENKAIVLQVKSKKLTELARKGNDKEIINDFKGAVQKAYDQGKKSRNALLNTGYNFFNENGDELFFENVNEVYIMGIVTEDYPSLTFQSVVFLEKEKEDPYPLFASIFDLDLITYFLDDASIFFDYVKKRICYANNIMAREEASILGKYLYSGFSGLKDYNLIIVESDFGSFLDSCYLPLMDYGL